MYRELNKKRIILEKRKPYTQEAYEKIAENDLVDFVYTSLRLDGSQFSREMVEKILVEGGFSPDLSLEDHVKAHKYREVLSYLKGLYEMQTDISLPVITEIYSMISGDKTKSLRSDDPFIYEWNYRVPDHCGIRDSLNILVNWIGRDGKVYDRANPLETEGLKESPSDFILRAAYLHDRLAVMYPYGRYSASVARTVMYYYIMSKGYPVFELETDQEQYNDMIAEYAENGDVTPLYNCIAGSVLHKLESLMEITG